MFNLNSKKSKEGAVWMLFLKPPITKHRGGVVWIQIFWMTCSIRTLSEWKVLAMVGNLGVQYVSLYILSANDILNPPKLMMISLFTMFLDFPW